MSEYDIIKPHSFEDAKQHIQTFSKRTSPDLGLDKVSTSGGLFGLFDHNVTGEELNSVTGQIQDYLIKFNGLHTDFINEFGQVYKALESLDKEYIPAILSAVKGAERASTQAKAAQEDIRKTIEAQKKIIKVLEDHKRKLDKLKHLGNVDEIWNTSKILEKDMDSFKTRSDEMKKQFSKLEGSLKALQKFADGILDYEHLEDIDEMWHKMNSFRDEISDVIKKSEDMSASIEDNIRSIEDIESRLSVLNEYHHLNDIDSVWFDVETHKKEILELQNAKTDSIQKIESLKEDTSVLFDFKNDLEKQNHLKDIDGIWDKAENNKNDIIQIRGDLNQNGSRLKSLFEFLEDEKGSSEKLKERVKKAESHISSQQESLDKLAQIKHLSEVDELWNQNDNNSNRIEELGKNTETNSSDVEELKKQLTDAIANIDVMKTKLKVAYYLGGGAIFICAIELILHLVRLL